MEHGGTFRLDVVKPDGSVLSETVAECVIPGALGSLGVLPMHAPLLTVLGTGELKYRIGNVWRYLAISGGFCEVRPDRVTVLAESAEKAESIDVARATRARDRAQEQLSRVMSLAPEQIEEAREAAVRAETRLAVARHAVAGVS